MAIGATQNELALTLVITLTLMLMAAFALLSSSRMPKKSLKRRYLYHIGGFLVLYGSAVSLFGINAFIFFLIVSILMSGVLLWSVATDLAQLHERNARQAARKKKLKASSQVEEAA